MRQFCVEIAPSFNWRNIDAALPREHSVRRYCACHKVCKFCVSSSFASTHSADLRKYFLRNCANCAKFGADLQPCTLKNHYFAPHTTGFRAVGQPLREHLPGFWAREARAAADRGDEKGSGEHKSFSVSLFRRPQFSTAAAAAEIGRREEAQRKKKRKKSFPSLFSRSRDKVRRGINYTE